MAFEWDPRKAAVNLAKHGIDFADAIGVFEDDRAVTIADKAPDEERHVTSGSGSSRPARQRAGNAGSMRSDDEEDV